MPRRPAFVGGVVLLVMLASGYATAASRHSEDPTGHASPVPVASVPIEPDGDPSPSPTPPNSGGAAAAQDKPPRGTLGPLGTKRLTGSKAVALTFDDGPHPEWTPKVLDRLRAERVKVTFCLIGKQVRRYPALVARIVREGHSLCNHSWQHDLNLGEKTEEEISADLARTTRQIRQAVPGVAVPYYRQPGGNWTPEVVEVSKKQGMVPLHWDVDPSDWEEPGARVISERVAQQARAGSIVLLHDGGGDRSGTLAASPEVIRTLRSEYGIVRLR
jgi:peptidoglycan/xylan/chitin deacetylase (PgdA/CDA1 family)